MPDPNPPIVEAVVAVPAAAPAAAPVVEAVVAAPAPEAAPVAAPAAEAPVETVKEPAVPAQAEFRPSLLEAAKVEKLDAEGKPIPADDKGKPAAEAKPAGDAEIKVEGKDGEKPPEGEAVKEPVAPPVELAPIEYKDFTLPDGFAPEPEKIGRFTAILGEYRAPQDLGQKLVDLHTAELQDAVIRLQQHNWETWNTQQDRWVDEFRADPELGRNKELTTLSNCATVIEQYGGTADQQTSVRKILTTTGAGNHPDIIRLLNNVAKILKEPSPVPAHQAPAPQASKADKRYRNS